MTLRPSKTFQFELLARELRRHRGGFGLDAAAAQMKNRWMFKTDVYVGLDIDEAALLTGMNRASKGPKARVLIADLSDRIPAETGTFRIVVSTNTFSCLGPAARENALSELARVTSADGTFICEIPIDDGAMLHSLESSFRSVTPIYFKNAFSRSYERMFEDKNGWLGSHPIAGMKPFLLLAWFVSRLEYLTCRFRAGNKHVLYICTGKIA